MITIQQSPKKDKKLMASDGKKTVHFGATGYSDYTRHKDPQRKQRYINRHKGEDWSKQNRMSPAFLSRYVLWGEPTLEASVKKLDQKYKDVKFTLLSAQSKISLK